MCFDGLPKPVTSITNEITSNKLQIVNDIGEYFVVCMERYSGASCTGSIVAKIPWVMTSSQYIRFYNTCFSAPPFSDFASYKNKLKAKGFYNLVDANNYIRDNPTVCNYPTITY